MDKDQWTTEINSVFPNCSIYEADGDTLAHIRADSIYEVSQELHSFSVRIQKHTELFEVESSQDNGVIFQLIYREDPQHFINKDAMRELIIDEVTVHTRDVEFVDVTMRNEWAELTFRTDVLDNSFSFSSLFANTKNPLYISNILAVSQGQDFTEYTVEVRAESHDENAIDKIRENIVKDAEKFDCPTCGSQNSVHWELHEFSNHEEKYPYFADIFVCVSCISMFVSEGQFDSVGGVREEPYSELVDLFEEYFWAAVKNDYCPVDVAEEKDKIEGEEFELYLWADESDTFYCTINSYGLQYPFVALFDDYKLSHLVNGDSGFLFEPKEKDLDRRTFVSSEHRGFCYLCGDELSGSSNSLEDSYYLRVHDECREQLNSLLSDLLEDYGEDIMMRKL